MEGTKRCTKCGEEKPVEEFYGRKRAVDGLEPLCRLCKKDYSRSYYAPERRRERALKGYGLTIDGYGALLASQDCRCWVCGKHDDDEHKCLSVDHDHATGRIRGLLCGKCNRAIGLLGDTPETVLKAYEYLLHNGESADAVLGVIEDGQASANAYVTEPLTETGAA